MPKIERVRRKYQRGPLSLLSSLQKDSDVQAKRKKSSAKSEQEHSEDEGAPGLEAEALNDKELVKIDRLSRDALLEMDDESPDLEAVENDYEDYGEELSAYPMERVLPMAEDDEESRGMQFEQTRTIGDLIFDKLQHNTRAEAEAEKMALFTESTIALFKKVGLYMSRYRSGKLPKALRFITNLRNWLDVLWLTNPEKWTPHAVAAATPMFVNSTTELQARSYMSYVLLPSFLKDLAKSEDAAEEGKRRPHTARLNVHLYGALCKCLYRPALFFKAIYFPVILAEEGCSYKQAVLLSSVISRESFPSIQAAAAIIKLCQHEPQSNPLYYCILRLINKKHNLPVSAVRIIAAYFISAAQKAPVETAVLSRNADARSSSRKSYTALVKRNVSTLPVIWHQTLLVFIQRWANELTAEEREGFKRVFKRQFHPLITDECRKQLFQREHAAMQE